MNIPPTRTMRIAATLACAGLVLTTACGDDGGPSGPSNDVQNNLVLTHDDASPVQFSSQAELWVWCGPWEDMVQTSSLQVWWGGPTASQPRWHLKAVVADVTIGEQNIFPNVFVWDQPEGVEIFVFDAPTNECSTSTGGSSGHITFQELDCGSGGAVRFSIDAVIGSELHGGSSLTVTGTFRAPVGQPPEWAN